MERGAAYTVVGKMFARRKIKKMSNSELKVNIVKSTIVGDWKSAEPL